MKIPEWAAAAREVPELRTLLPGRPADCPNCSVCGGAGWLQLTERTWCWCGGCWGLGWRRQEGAPGLGAEESVIV